MPSIVPHFCILFVAFLSSRQRKILGGKKGLPPTLASPLRSPLLGFPILGRWGLQATQKPTSSLCDYAPDSHTEGEDYENTLSNLT